MGERLEPRPPARGGLPDPLRDGAHHPVLTRQQRDDPVGLTQLVGAQHDRLVAVEGHDPIVPRSGLGTPLAGACLPATEGEVDRGSGEALGSGPPLHDAGRPDELGVRHLLGQHRGVGGRVDRVGRVPDDQRRSRDRCAAGGPRARPVRRRSRGPRPPPSRDAGRRCPARCRPRTARRPAGSAGSPTAARGCSPAGTGRRTAAARTPGSRPPGRCRAPASRAAGRGPAPARARRPPATRWRRARSRRRRPARRRGGRAGRRPARRTRSSSRPAGPPGRSDRPWPSRSSVTTWSPSLASARASGSCIRRGMSCPWSSTTQRSPAPYSVYSSRSRPDSPSRKNWPIRSETNIRAS